jgi:hypothetical protein
VDNLDVGGFLSTMLAALLIAILTSIMSLGLQRWASEV